MWVKGPGERGGPEDVVERVSSEPESYQVRVKSRLGRNNVKHLRKWFERELEGSGKKRRTGRETAEI